MPLWDDLQAPCAPNYTQHIDSNTATAQGVTAADSAVNVLLDLNLPDSIAWLDIEKYPRPTEAGGGADCSQAVQAYVNGFVYEMHSYGYSAGVYANGAYIWDDMNQDTLSNVPDAIWVPQYPGPGYAVQPLRVLDDGGYNLYVYEQRIHQVAENIPTGFSNGEPSQVDTDFIDGPVVAGPYNTVSCNCDVCDPSCPNYDPNQCDDQGSWVLR